MEDIRQVVTQLFVATDQRNWEKAKECFASKVVLDYSSMSGEPATELTPGEIISSWQSILPGFESTHHQLGNFLITIERDKAQTFCYGTATHYLDNDLWTVVGSYDFKLLKDPEDTWKISQMTFHFKYQSGNTSLVEKAILSVKTDKK